jgi:hypothetical protein
MAFSILTSKDEITKEDVERCKQKDLLESMLEEMAGGCFFLFKRKLGRRKLRFVVRQCKYSSGFQISHSSGNFKNVIYLPQIGCPALGVWVAYFKRPALPGKAPQTKTIL